MLAFNMRSEIVQSRPFLKLRTGRRFAGLADIELVISITDSRTCSVYGFSMSLKVILCSESFFAGTEIASERLLMLQLVFTIHVSTAIGAGAEFLHCC